MKDYSLLRRGKRMNKWVRRIKFNKGEGHSSWVKSVFFRTWCVVFRGKLRGTPWRDAHQAGSFLRGEPPTVLGFTQRMLFAGWTKLMFCRQPWGKKNNPKLIICCRTKEKKNNIKILTLISIIAKGVEHGHGDVDQAGQVEGDAPPQRDVAWEPEQGLIFCTNTTGSISTGTQNLSTQTCKCRCRPLNLFWNNNNQTLWVIIMIFPSRCQRLLPPSLSLYFFIFF